MHKRAIIFTILLFVLVGCIPFAARNDAETEEPETIVNLVVDVIPGADVGSGSRENWLRERAEEFERKNTGIFITVRSLKVDQAELIYTNDLRQQMGNITAYTCGALKNNACFLPLESGKLAQPYMYAGYVLLINPALCQKIENAWQIPSVAAAESVFDSGVLLAAQQFSPTQLQMMSGERSEMISQFQSGEVCAIVASNYLAYRFCRLADSDDGFPVEMLPLSSGFTDQMHYVSVVDQTDAQNAAAKAFVQYLLSDSAQETCADIGMFSLDDTFHTYEQGTILADIWENQRNEPIYPDPFGWIDTRPLATQLARDVLAGNQAALNDLVRLLQNLAIDSGIG